MSLSIITKTVAKATLLFTLGTSIAFASFSDKILGNSASFIIEQLKGQIPGLDWDKVVSNEDGELEFTNLHYLSQNFGYNPFITKELVDTGKAKNIVSGAIPDLLEVKLPKALISFKLSCLLTQDAPTSCINKFRADLVEVTAAFGDKERKDFFRPQDLENLKLKDLLPAPNSRYHSSNLPTWLNLELADFKIKELRFLAGSNIGLAQLAMNRKVVEKLKADPEADLEGMKFVPTVAQSYLEDLVHPSLYNGYIADPYYFKIENLTLKSLRINNQEAYLDGLTADKVDLIISDNTSAISLEDATNYLRTQVDDKGSDCGTLCSLTELKDDYSSPDNFGNFFRTFFQLGKGISPSFTKVESYLTTEQKQLPVVRNLLDSVAELRTKAKNGEPINSESATILELYPQQGKGQLVELPSARELKNKLNKYSAIFEKPLKDYIEIKNIKFTHNEIKNVDLSNITLLVLRGSADNFIENLRYEAEESSLAITDLPAYYPVKSQSIPYYYSPLYLTSDTILEEFKISKEFSTFKLEGKTTPDDIVVKYLLEGDVYNSLDFYLNNNGNLELTFILDGDVSYSLEAETEVALGAELKGNLEDKVLLSTHIFAKNRDFLVNEETDEETLDQETSSYLYSFTTIDFNKPYWPLYSNAIEFVSSIKDDHSKLNHLAKYSLAGPLNTLVFNSDTYFPDDEEKQFLHVKTEFINHPDINNDKKVSFSSYLAEVNTQDVAVKDYLKKEEIAKQEALELKGFKPKALEVVTPTVHRALTGYYMFDHFFSTVTQNFSERKSALANLSLELGDSLDLVGKFTILKDLDRDSLLSKNLKGLFDLAKGEENLYLVYGNQKDWSIFYNPLKFTTKGVEAKAYLLDSFTGFDLIK